jgi:hypothetical protein
MTCPLGRRFLSVFIRRIAISEIYADPEKFDPKPWEGSEPFSAGETHLHRCGLCDDGESRWSVGQRAGDGAVTPMIS